MSGGKDQKKSQRQMSEQFVEHEKRQYVDQEDAREMKQPWWKRTKEEVNFSSNELEQGEWPYDSKLEWLTEECEGKIGSSVSLFMHITHKNNDSPLITLGQIGDKGDGPTNHIPSHSK